MTAAKIWNGTSWELLGMPVVPSESSSVVATAINLSTTSATDITGLTTTLTVPATDTVYMIDVSLDLGLNTANAVSIFELYIDGVLFSASQLIWAPVTAGSRTMAGKRWRVTGLSAGSHTFKITGRLAGAGTNAVTVNGGHSTMQINRVATPGTSGASAQSTAPSAPVAGQLWYDTSDNPPGGNFTDTGWINVAGGVGFQNSWIDFDARTARYRKLNGVVYTEGIIKNGTVGAVAFQYPAGFRCSSRVVHDKNLILEANSAPGYVSLDGNGNFSVLTGSNVWVDLSGLPSFPADN